MASAGAPVTCKRRRPSQYCYSHAHFTPTRQGPALCFCDSSPSRALSDACPYKAQPCSRPRLDGLTQHPAGVSERYDITNTPAAPDTECWETPKREI